MHKLSPRQLADNQRAEAERKRCREWLLQIMRASPVKTRSKDDLRAEAMRDLNVSKASFDVAWIWAIEDMGYRDWYEPLRKGRRPNRRRLN
jgi:hypothetical protein